jgi:hypothetical protein
VNQSKLIYMLNAGAVVSNSVLVYVSGGLVSRGADYTTLLEMQAVEPEPDTYRLFTSSTAAYVRLGFNPAGQVTVNAAQDAFGSRADQLVDWIVSNYLGLLAEEINFDDFTAMAAINSAPLGRYVTEEVTIRDILEYFTMGVGAWFGFDINGVFRTKILVAPSGTPDVVFKRLSGAEVAENNTVDIVDIVLSTTADFGSGLPNWQVQLQWAPNPTVMQDSAIAQSVQDPRRTNLKTDFKTVTATDLGVLTKHLLAIEYRTMMPTWLGGAAQIEATRLQALRGVRRDYFTISTQIGAGNTGDLDLGSIVEIRLPRFGLDAGKLFVILGITTDPSRQMLEYNLWG